MPVQQPGQTGRWLLGMVVTQEGQLDAFLTLAKRNPCIFVAPPNLFRNGSDSPLVMSVKCGGKKVYSGKNQPLALRALSLFKGDITIFPTSDFYLNVFFKDEQVVAKFTDLMRLLNDRYSPVLLSSRCGGTTTHLVQTHPRADPQAVEHFISLLSDYYALPHCY